MQKLLLLKLTISGEQQDVQAAAPKGIVCNTGILGNEWTIKNFEPLVDMPSTVKLTIYNSEAITAANSTKALKHVVEGVSNGHATI